MGNPVKCFIVEGKDRDYRFVQGMVQSVFKGRYDAITICLPAEQNIYMLYGKLEEDGFETDLIELLREDNSEAAKALANVDRQSIDEVFLFFDFDVHQDNLKSGRCSLDVLQRMIAFFDNETENGKLYISYPMVEALYDYEDGYCQAFTQCFFPVDQAEHYKERVGTDNRNVSCHFSKYENWRTVVSIFGLRVSCLFQVETVDFNYYRKNVSVESIFERQCSLLQGSRRIFVISAFPEFLLDYYGESFWKSNVRLQKKRHRHCPKQ